MPSKSRRRRNSSTKNVLHHTNNFDLLSPDSASPISRRVDPMWDRPGNNATSIVPQVQASNGSALQHNHHKIDTQTSERNPALASVISEFKRRYIFKWACENCVADSEFRQDNSLVVLHKKIHENCRNTILLAKYVDEKRQLFAKIRVGNYQNSESFRLCWLFITDDREECEYGDKCSLAHSELELEFWTFAKRKNLAIKDIFAALHPNYIAAPVQANNRSESDGAGCDAVQPTGVAYTNGSTDGPKPLPPILVNYEVHLACLECYVPDAKMVKPYRHECTRSVFLVRKRVSDDDLRDSPETHKDCNDWHVVRQWNNSFQPVRCRNYHPGSSFMACTLAHSDVELKLWSEPNAISSRIDEDLRERLLSMTVVESSKTATLPLPNGRPGLVQVWVACDFCATFVSCIYYVLRLTDHNCQANIVFIRSPQLQAQPEYWLFVRKPPGGKVDLTQCKNISLGCSLRTKCQNPHSIMERHLWSSSGQFMLTNFLQSHTTAGKMAVHQWSPKTLTTLLQLPEPAALPVAQNINAVTPSSVGQNNNGPPARSAVVYKTDISPASSAASRTNSAQPLVPKAIHPSVEGRSSRTSERVAPQPSSVAYAQREEEESNLNATSSFDISDSDLTSWVQKMKSSHQTTRPTRQNCQAIEKIPRTVAVHRPSPQLPSITSFNCPFGIDLVCMSCFKSSGKFIHRNGTYCGNKNVNHSWEQHKGAVFIDSGGTGAVFVPRDLPPSLKSKVQAGRGIPRLRMCSYQESHKRCPKYNCDFAHSTAELRLWTWFMQTGANVASCIEMKAKKEAAEQRRVPEIKKPEETVKNNRSLVSIERHLRGEKRYCVVCNKYFRSIDKLEEHVKTAVHQDGLNTISIRIWNHRPPTEAPPFKLCQRHLNGGNCEYSESPDDLNGCENAHSQGELDEWHEMTALLKAKTDKKAKAELKSLREKVKEAKAESDVLCPLMDDAQLALNGSNPRLCQKNETGYWIFNLTTFKNKLTQVLLYNDATWTNFKLSTLDGSCTCSAFENGDAFADEDIQNSYSVKVEFTGSQVAQTLFQTVIFDFGTDRKLSYRLTVHVDIDPDDVHRQAKLRKELMHERRWTPDNCEIIWISKERDARPMDLESVVANLNFEINSFNYFSLTKQWLYAEEYKRQRLLDDIRMENVSAQLTDEIYDESGNTVRPTFEGALFAEIQLDQMLSEDVDIYNLFRDCSNAFIALTGSSANLVSKTRVKKKVYEVAIVDKRGFGVETTWENRIYLQLSRLFVQHMKLDMKKCSSMRVDIQFNLSHMQFRKWIGGLDLLQTRELSHLIFPDLANTFLGYLSGRIYSSAMEKISGLTYVMRNWEQKHNEEQCNVMKHVMFCATNKADWIPPLVIFGPFGTGKTRTIAAATAELLRNTNFAQTKILICAYSNTTTDMYIKLLKEATGWSDNELAPVLWRVFAKQTKKESLPPFIHPYFRTTWDVNTNQPYLTPLTANALRSVRVVLCTIVGSQQLVKVVNEETGASFTHIFIDEAAQALEVETIIPLCVAVGNTCVVVAGDHHQIRPTVYLDEAKQLSCSYLERLYYFYEKQRRSVSMDRQTKKLYPSVLFNKNYRSHKTILEFISAEFYGGNSSLKAEAKTPYSYIKPLNFVATADAKEVVTAEGLLENYEEAQEVVNQLIEMWHNWPEEWGNKNIGVAVQYYGQIRLIKELLRQKRLTTHSSTIDVTKVSLMQGKDYKVLVIAAVRGNETLKKDKSHHLGFLDDERLINTALTRAKYAVVVVGDPVVMCSVGKCRDIWYRYVQACVASESFYSDYKPWRTVAEEIERNRETSGFDAPVLQPERKEVDGMILELMAKTNLETCPPTQSQLVGNNQAWSS